jgi:hypothetical protein
MLRPPVQHEQRLAGARLGDVKPQPASLDEAMRDAVDVGKWSIGHCREASVIYTTWYRAPPLSSTTSANSARPRPWPKIATAMSHAATIRRGAAPPIAVR